MPTNVSINCYPVLSSLVLRIHGVAKVCQLLGFVVASKV